MKYIAIPRAWASETHVPEVRPSCDVFETDKSPVATGIVNAQGVPLYRVVETLPIGFVGRAAP